MTADRQADAKLSMGPPDLWHDRARAAAVEQRQLLITLATACLAVFFVTLTGDNAVKLALWQRVLARVGLLCMGISVFGGVIAVFGDARRCYNLARHLQAVSASEPDLAAIFQRHYDAYYRTLIFSNWIQRIAFLAGIASTVSYTLTLIK